MTVYSEACDAGNAYRARYLTQLQELIAARYGKAERMRSEYFRPDMSSVAAYESSIEPFRQGFVELLGWPLVARPEHIPTLREELVGEDELGSIHRVWIETLPGLETYGILFTPSGPGPFPVVISQHGGGGTPELCSDLFRPANYNDMSRRVLRHGCVVFAPQLPMWSEEYGPAADRPFLDLQLKHLGGSGVALDVFQLQRCLDVLITRPEVDGTRIGMQGLSWGGFYTLVTAAADPRIKAALASSFINDARTGARITPQVWFGAANRFHFAEIAGLICPRPLYVEVGVHDEHVVVTNAASEAAGMRTFYDGLGIADRFVYDEHPGGHEFGTADTGIEFLVAALRAVR